MFKFKSTSEKAANNAAKLRIKRNKALKGIDDMANKIGLINLELYSSLGDLHAREKKLLSEINDVNNTKDFVSDEMKNNNSIRSKISELIAIKNG